MCDSLSPCKDLPDWVIRNCSNVTVRQNIRNSGRIYYDEFEETTFTDFGCGAYFEHSHITASAYDADTRGCSFFRMGMVQRWHIRPWQSNRMFCQLQWLY